MDEALGHSNQPRSIHDIPEADELPKLVALAALQEQAGDRQPLHKGNSSVR
jgi:hypothetical protein